MKKTKLISLLDTFSKPEFKRFKAFANSPYFNTNGTIIRFLNILEKYIFQKKEKDIDRKQVFAKVYPGLNYNEGTLTVLRSQTLNLLENFLTEERSAKDKRMRQKYLAEAYKEKGLTERFKKQFLVYEKLNEGTRESDELKHAHQLQILLEKLSWGDFATFETALKSINQVIKETDIFFLTTKLKLTLIQTNYERVSGKSNDLSFLKETFLGSVKSHEDNNKMLQLYMALVDLIHIKDFSLSSVQDFIEEFFSVEHGLHFLDKFIIHSEIQNYLSRNTQGKSDRIYSIKFDTNLKAIRLGLLAKDSELFYKDFLVIAKMGSMAKRFDEVHKFIENNAHYISPKYQEATKTLARAEMLRFINTDEAWKEIELILLNFHHPDVTFKLSGRVLGIRTLYRHFDSDSTYYKPLVSQINAFKAFLKREKLYLKMYYKSNWEFSNYLLKVVKIKMKEPYKDMSIKREVLYSRIEEDKNLKRTLQTWLLSITKNGET